MYECERHPFFLVYKYNSYRYFPPIKKFTKRRLKTYKQLTTELICSRYWHSPDKRFMTYYNVTTGTYTIWTKDLSITRMKLT